VDAPTLAGRLFGADSGARWAALLPGVLAGDERLDCQGGRWRLARSRASTRQAVAEPASLKDDAPPIVTLALATTGADPRRHRIARIAVVRHERGEATSRLDAVVGTGRRLSRYLRDAARVSLDDLDGAPTFADVVPELRALLDGHVVHAYGARRAQAFLDAELRRAGLPPLDSQLAEIDVLVGSLLPGSRKPGLFAAADELGVPHNGRGSPLAEAGLAARIVARVRERLAASPARPSLADDRPAHDPDRPLPFTRDWLRTVPEGPGVCVVEDEAGRALYVGKAAGLRRRLASYVGRQPSLHRRLESLAVRAAAVTAVPAPSDLEATLLEARLIRERQPAFNVARVTRLPTTIVRAAPDAPSPSVRLVAEVAADGARYFGPFESVSAARQLLHVTRSAYPEAFARRRGDVDRQRAAVLAVCRLLSGQKQPTLALLRERMHAAAGAGDRAEVDRLRAALRDVQALTTRPSDLAGLAGRWRLLVLERLFEDGPGRLHLVQDGRLVASVDTNTSALPDDPARLRRFADATFGDPGDADEDGEIGRPASWLPEDTTILLRWLAQARARIDVRRLPADEPAAGP
jgi:DNA polymerase III epsilon subunit-like protein